MSFPFYNHALPLQSLAGSSNSHPHRSRRGRAAHSAHQNQQHQQQQQQHQQQQQQSQNQHNNHFRNALAVKPQEVIDSPHLTAFRVRFEAAVSFDLDDDLEFCPALLTDEDIYSIHSSPSSDRSSLSSLSPEHSPLQQQLHPLPQVSTFSLSASNQSYLASAFQPATSPSTFTSNTGSYFSPSSPMKGAAAAAAAAAQRARNVIAIVDPSTGMRMPSPPNSVSPARMAPGMGRPRW